MSARPCLLVNRPARQDTAALARWDGAPCLLCVLCLCSHGVVPQSGQTEMCRVTVATWRARPFPSALTGREIATKSGNWTCALAGGEVADCHDKRTAPHPGREIAAQVGAGVRASKAGCVVTFIPEALVRATCAVAAVSGYSGFRAQRTWLHFRTTSTIRGIENRSH